MAKNNYLTMILVANNWQLLATCKTSVVKLLMNELQVKCAK